MNMHVRIKILMAALVSFSAWSCTTEGETRRTVDDNDKFSNQENVDPFATQELRIKQVIDALPSTRGPSLLRVVQYLIAQKQLAVPHLLAVLPNSDARTRSNILYILSWHRGDETRQALLDHLNYDDVAVRYEAASGLLQQGDLSAAPVLVDLLEHEDRQTRFKAIEALRTALGRDFGFNFAASADERAQGVKKWRSWWNTEKQRLMVRRPSTSGEEKTVSTR